MPSDERVELNINANVSVPAVGASLIMTFSMNGNWFPFMNQFDSVEDMLAFWMKIPSYRNYLLDLFNFGVRPSNVWIDLYASQLLIQPIGGGDPEPAGEGLKLFVKTADGVPCGYGKVLAGSVLMFTPVYGNDIYEPGKTGANAGDALSLFIGVQGNAGVRQVFPQSGTIIWAGMGNRIELTALLNSPTPMPASPAEIGTNSETRKA